MGASQSQQTFNKIARALPQVNEHLWDDDDDNNNNNNNNNNAAGKGNKKPFRNDQDRTQFIYSLTTLISNNGTSWLPTHDFRLLLSRTSTTTSSELFYTFIATDTISGAITAKIEPSRGGATRAEAFGAFKAHVEGRLREMLKSVPDSTAAHSSAEAARHVAVMEPEEPPAYEAGRDVYVGGGGGRKL